MIRSPLFPSSFIRGEYAVWQRTFAFRQASVSRTTAQPLSALRGLAVEIDTGDCGSQGPQLAVGEPVAALAELRRECTLAHSLADCVSSSVDLCRVGQQRR